MKIIPILFLLFVFSMSIYSQDSKTIFLSEPDKTAGKPVMEAFSLRASVRDWSDQPLSVEDLSGLLWAANGINRPDGRRTAPSAMNAQDIDLYVFLEGGVYLYNPGESSLEPVIPGDHRNLTGKTSAPVTLVLVSDISRFRYGTDANRLDWAKIDAGIVSQNISLFCAGMGLRTRPKASFPDMEKIRETLLLKSSQHVILNHPVGYPAK